ncbi:MAG: magnesium-translocating P-type ATPase [Firmicutes bacterium]|nr:magnesium-translocating P-type ATPase [Bacillota bacterium]
MKLIKRKEPAEKSQTGNDKLLEAARSEGQALLDKYNNTIEQGYDEQQVEAAQEKYGKNQISHKDQDTLGKRLMESFVNPFTIVLFVLSIIMIVFDLILPIVNNEPDNVDPWGFSILIVMVLLSGGLRFVQEMRSSNAAEKLKSMIRTTTCVVRDGKKIEIPLDEVVVGDIVWLASGDMIPADLRILYCKDLFVGESSLTGESEPIEKTYNQLTFDHMNALELNNLAFMGTNVVSGTAMAIVIATGDHSQFGSVARTLVGKRNKTSFDKGVNSVSWLLIRFMALMVPTVFVVNGITKGVVLGGGLESWVQALMFGLAIAVGLTPEMLPMIVTTGLAKGAVNMSKKKTVVKSINSIQNFGAMDILCTDKTGTLTEDEIALEYYLDISGNEDTRILRHAFINSYYQTGVKNVMDNAILKHSKDKEMLGLMHNYIKVDEIPFDFIRRRMSVVVKSATGKTQLITKGAVDEMLSICSQAEYGGGVNPVPLTDSIKANILQKVEKLSSEGLRVLCIAQKNNPSVEGVFGIHDENDMVLIGYLAFLDPPKQSATAALQALKEHGVQIKILTGDSLPVTRCVASKVGLNADRFLIGSQITSMTDAELSAACQEVTIFAKLTPQQKVRIVKLLKDNGHVVGFMGDGINDSGALKEADVGISVDGGVDIAKEFADIILLEKDLMVLEQGIIEGRKTFANIVKYIKMTASSNFGNMFSVVVGSALMPFLPMLPIQILTLNLIYDISCMSIPWDNVDAEYLKKPRKWEASSIGKFMWWIGPTSSVFDLTTFGLMLFYITPKVLGIPLGTQYAIWNPEGFGNLSTEQQLQFMAIFQAGWFVLSLWTQTLIIHFIRTEKLPFVKSRASWTVTVPTMIGVIIGTVLPFTIFGEVIGMHSLPAEFFAWLALTLVCYAALVTLFKRIFIRRYGELL